MSQWGSKNFNTKPFGVGLQDIVADFPSGLKQAMYAAANKGSLKRGTWNNCAFDAAANNTLRQAGNPLYKAAEMFKVSPAMVSTFINHWDRMVGSDEECTQKLRDAIEQAGLFSEPGQKPPRIIKMKVYEDQQKKLREQFDSLMEANMIEGTDVMEELLCGSSC